ncbi:MAG: T9SS type A sorting domain-containing protein [Bacteroidales bacterium]|nr:T9SS type A sorting domain-containing protein [Bacteroidales bacterium]
MKTKLIISLIISISTLTLYAQNEIVSIWMGDSVIIYTHTVNQSNDVYWGPTVEITTGGGADDQYYGLNNTNDIVLQLGDNGGVPYAARICDTLTAGGYSDWYLPARYELWTMCLKKDSIGGSSSFTINSPNIWSSTEVSYNKAWCSYACFEGNSLPKSESGNVRCIRREYPVGNTNLLTNNLEVSFINETRELFVHGSTEINPIIEVYDIKGNSVFRDFINAPNTQCNERISLKELNTGVYIISIQAGQNLKTMKCIIY